jgi:hypothetical protein
MNRTFQLDVAADDSIEAKREIIRHFLNEVANNVGKRLRDADLSYPVYICIPSGGNAVVSMMTPLDPSDEDWRRIGDIVRAVLSEYLDGMGLRSVELPCTLAHAAAEIASD